MAKGTDKLIAHHVRVMRMPRSAGSGAHDSVGLGDRRGAFPKTRYSPAPTAATPAAIVMVETASDVFMSLIAPRPRLVQNTFPHSSSATPFSATAWRPK